MGSAVIINNSAVPKNQVSKLIPSSDRDSKCNSDHVPGDSSVLSVCALCPSFTQHLWLPSVQRQTHYFPSVVSGNGLWKGTNHACFGCHHSPALRRLFSMPWLETSLKREGRRTLCRLCGWSPRAGLCVASSQRSQQDPQCHECQLLVSKHLTFVSFERERPFPTFQNLKFHF